MSHSYKKFYICRQDKEDYHYLNRQLRHDKLREIPKGAHYRKVNPKWREQQYLWTEEQAMRQYENDVRLQSRYSYLEWMQYWARHIRRK